MTFEDLKRVNEGVKHIEVKGKAYACVAARVQAFRELYPNGSITTDILSLENGVVTMKSTVFDDQGNILATGHAQEKETASQVNKTSFIENCETSAVGRALGMLGIGSDEQMASAEEVANAINQQEISRDDMIKALDAYYTDPTRKKETIAWAINKFYTDEDKNKLDRELTEFRFMKQYALAKVYAVLMERINATQSES
jgi:hypothetical protein